jgi:hypothetical protein
MEASRNNQVWQAGFLLLFSVQFDGERGWIKSRSGACNDDKVNFENPLNWTTGSFSRPRLPIDSAKSCHNVEMPVSAQNWKSVLAAERGDPDIIGRNRSSSFLEFRAKRGVINGRLLVHVKDAVILERIH